MTEQKLDELIPCPFHKLNTCVKLTDNIHGRWYVTCGGCGASSGHHKTKEQAAASWNGDRASVTREAELQVEVRRNKKMIVIYQGDIAAFGRDSDKLQAEVRKLKKSNKELTKGMEGRAYKYNSATGNIAQALRLINKKLEAEVERLRALLQEYCTASEQGSQHNHYGAAKAELNHGS